MFEKTQKTSLTKIVLGLGVILSLSACKTTTARSGQPNTSIKPMTAAEEKADRTEKINSALEKAAVAAASKGEDRQSLGYLEEAYKRNSTDPVTALNYGVALSNSKEYERAALVLAPFANDAESAPVFKTEYAAVQLGLGKNEEAEKYAQKAVLQDSSQVRAYHYLGIALETQGKHKEAERAFRKGLANWQGDPVPIMNNLALNLAAQGYLEESLEILQKAKNIAPDRIEIERNLRIVKALQESYAYQPYVEARPKSLQQQ